MPYAPLADTLVRDLKLSRAPLGIAFLKEPPVGVRRYGEAVPSACAFWKSAEHELFYATAEDHYNCPIGAITQGFLIPKEVTDKATALIEQMGKISYLEAAEAQNVPTVDKGHRVVVYGPLKDFGDIPVDVALLVCAPFQAMLLSEAGGIVSWSGQTESRALGRPACAVIPSALKSGVITISMGCMGARTFAGIREQELLVAIPAATLAEFQHRLPTLLKANSHMKDFYQAHKGNFTPLAGHSDNE